MKETPSVNVMDLLRLFIGIRPVELDLPIYVGLSVVFEMTGRR